MREKNSRQHKDMLLGLHIQEWSRPCIGVRVVTGCAPYVFCHRVVFTLSQWAVGKGCLASVADPPESQAFPFAL